MFTLQKYKGKVNTEFRWLILLLLGISKNTLEDNYKIYTIHITPFIEISFGYKGTRGGYEKIN